MCRSLLKPQIPGVVASLHAFRFPQHKVEYPDAVAAGAFFVIPIACIWTTPITLLRVRFDFESCSRFADYPIAVAVGAVSPFSLLPFLTHTRSWVYQLLLPRSGALAWVEMGGVLVRASVRVPRLLFVVLWC